MLDFMRKNANSWLMVLLFAIIIFVFAINFGPWAGRAGGGLHYAAEVNGKAISLLEFQQIYSNYIRQMQTYRPDFNPSGAEAAHLKKMIVDHMVNQELMAQVSAQDGLSIPDKELAAIIQKRIFGNEKFDADQYKKIVQNVFQTTESQFEDMVRKELLSQRAGELIETGALITTDELKQAFQDRKNKASLDFVKIDPAYFKSKQAPSNEQAQAFAAKNIEDIKAYYNDHIKDYRSEKKVKARHILVKVSPQATESEKTAAKEKIMAAHKRVKANEDFAKVAQEVSQDGSAQNGGDLGYFGQGTMVKPFEEAAFKLNPGEVSEIVETPFGYHIIKVEDIKLPSHQGIDSVKLEIAKILLEKRDSESKAKEYANGLLAKLKVGTPMSQLDLPKEASADAPKKDNTGLFNRKTRFVPGIGESPQLLAAAFALTKEKPVSDQVFDVKGKLYVVALKTREAADMNLFDQEKEEIKRSIMDMRKHQYMQAYQEELKKNASIKYNDALIQSADAPAEE